MKLLDQKIALITGGTRGIGKAIAKTFIEQGATVIIFGKNPERGKEAVKDLEPLCEEGQQIYFLPVDVSDSTQVTHSMESVFTKFKRIDILINNAGVTKDGLLMRMKQEDWDQVLNTNLSSLFRTSKAVIRHMIKQKFGKIINITSIVGLTGNAGQTNYAASKAGMIGFTKSLAQETASRGVCVNCIAPGFIETDMTNGLSEAHKEAFLAQIPMKKMGQPQDIANTALFLASDLSNYVTGQTLTVDGGLVMS